MTKLVRLICSVLLCCISLPLFAQDQEPKNKIRITLRTPQSEVEDAIVFLSKMTKEDANFTRFFSTYAILPDKREDVILTLSFICHSLTGLSKDPKTNYATFSPFAERDEDGTFLPYKLVPGSETLWYFDLRDYNWTPQAWEKISIADGYFAEPIVTPDRSGILRLLSGNAVVRADWFIFHAVDTTAQQDLFEEETFYDILLYASSDRPKNQAEWRKHWGIDIERSRALGNEYGTLATKSAIVSRHNRYLFGYRSEIGYLYETYDVQNLEGLRDYVETLFKNKRPGGPPDVSDAGEMFATNQLGLQVYALRNGAGELVNFGDPTLVRHLNDVVDDVRVRTAHSCIDCHATGPLQAENTLREFVEAGGDLFAKNKADASRVRRNLLSGRFEETIEDNQKIFARAIKRTNGLDPQTNGQLYLQAIKDYRAPLDLDRASFECGVGAEEFKETILNADAKFGARLKLLLLTGEPIPREAWEHDGKDGVPGIFQQAMILINGLTVIEEKTVVENIDKPTEKVFVAQQRTAVLKDPNYNSAVLATLQPGFEIRNIIERKGEFMLVAVRDRKTKQQYSGWVNSGNFRSVSR